MALCRLLDRIVLILFKKVGVITLIDAVPSMAAMDKEGNEHHEKARLQPLLTPPSPPAAPPNSPTLWEDTSADEVTLYKLSDEMRPLALPPLRFPQPQRTHKLLLRNNEDTRAKQWPKPPPPTRQHTNGEAERRSSEKDAPGLRLTPLAARKVAKHAPSSAICSHALGAAPCAAP